MPRQPKKDRAIPHDSIALRHAFDCSIPALRKAALEHVRAVVKDQGGSTKAIAAELGISVSTWWRWVQAIPELRAVHYKHRPDHGPAPAGLET